MAMIQGWCEPAFKRVQDAFAASFSDRLPDQDREHGAALAAIVNGKMVVDLWGGWADKAATRPWTRDTGGVVKLGFDQARWERAIEEAPALHAPGASLISAASPLSKETLHRATTQRWQGVEEMTGAEWRMGLGLMLSNPFADFGPSARAFGHPGAGGVAGFVDPERRLAIGYLPNKPFMRPGTGERGPRLTRAILEVTG
jgi:CubicO group peptidase (beta-lactamase class C family)